MKEVIKTETGYIMKTCNTTYENVIVIKCFNNELFFQQIENYSQRNYFENQNTNNTEETTNVPTVPSIDRHNSIDANSLSHSVVEL